jgi:iron complex outermembrane receptor protein
MFLKTHKVSAIRIAVVAAIGVMTMTAQAQNAQLERIEVTGSSIKRISSEGALPVQIITAKEIARTGATSVSDVLRNLPAMQGFQIADTAVGTNSGGNSNANIHDIGTQYTLVLLNGRRIAPTGAGSTVNLNSIPMSAIDRIEVLTDGASALYGSDAIAGVVNFVLKKNHQGGNVTVSGMVPLEGGGKSAYASATYGIGDVDKDRFNVLLNYRHDVQQQLKATDRSFGSTAYIPYSFGGHDYIYDKTSGSAVPANAQVTARTVNGKAAFPAYLFNPYAKANGGKCAPGNFASLTNVPGVQEICGYDFAKDIEIYPESKRDSLFLTGQFKATDKLSFFTEFAYSRFDLTARIAANPVPVAIPTSTDLFAKYVAPYLTPFQIANLSLETDKTSPNFGKPKVQANYRALDFGTRDSQTITDAKHFVIGADAELAGWTMNSGFTWSQNAIDEKYVGGYFKKTEFISMVQKNQFDPFAEAGKQTPETLKLMADSIYHGTVRKGEVNLTGLDFRASREIYKLPAGDLSLGLGGDIREQQYKNTPSADAVAGVIYNFSVPNAFDLKRKSGGVFGELLVPVIKNLELTAALRYDSIKPTKDGLANVTVGEDLSATTYKISGRYQVVPQVLMRASYGTGFKAPDMLSLASPLLPNGVTGSSFPCPYPGNVACKAKTPDQYTQLAGGNALIKPEKSEQMAFGIRFEPNSSFGIGADYYNVYITDAISAVSAAQAFADPAKFASLFTTYQQPAEDKPYYAFKSTSTNIGRAKNSGIDWDIVGRTNLDNIGRLTLSVAGTYVIESSYTLPGTSDQYTTSLSQYNDVSGSNTFRNKVSASAVLDTGAFTNSFILNWKSGYKDKTVSVRDVATNKLVNVAVDVPRSSTLDWQGVYRYNKVATLTVGVKNLFNKEPEFSLRDAAGQQTGYDPRYGDTLMRRVYATGSYDF